MREFPDRFTRIGKLPRWIQDTTASRCSSGHTCTQKMCNHTTSQGQGAPGKNGGPRSNHLHRPAHQLGIMDYLHPKGTQWASLMPRSTWPQQSNPPWPPQDAYCRRSHTWICKFMLLHQAWCTSWILVNSPWQRIKPLNYLQQPLWEVPFPASSLWSGLFTGHLPEEDGPAPWRVPWMYGNNWWHHHTWLYWGGTWCPSVECHVGSPQIWSCVHSTEDTCKGPSHKLLWLPIQCQWCPPRSREGWCCACSPSTHKCYWTPRVPQHGDISQPLCPWPVHSDCSSVRTPEKRCWLHLEHQLWGCFSASQASHCQWPPSDTVTHHCLWPYKLMPHR